MDGFAHPSRPKMYSVTTAPPKNGAVIFMLVVVK